METIKRQLAGKLIGLEIAGIEILAKKSFQGETADLTGAVITELKRLGKVLVFELNNGQSLVIHLKLTGQLVYQPPGGRPVVLAGAALPAKHTRVIFSFREGSKLFFNDLRMFGWIKNLARREVENLKLIKEYGPEPLSDEFTTEKLKELLKNWGRPVKLLLLEQSKISGVGNIYANEALFCAGIAPHHRGRELVRDHPEKIKKLRECLRQVLELGLKYGGASDNAYVDAFGEKGEMQEHLNVYGKAGQPCPNDCGGTIRRMTLGGRGAFFCPKCQR